MSSRYQTALRLLTVETSPMAERTWFPLKLSTHRLSLEAVFSMAYSQKNWSENTRIAVRKPRI